MDEPVMNRRGVPRGAGAVGAVALAGVAAASPAVASGNGDRGASGSWMITHQDDPPGDQTGRSMGIASSRSAADSQSPDDALSLTRCAPREPALLCRAVPRLVLVALGRDGGPR